MTRQSYEPRFWRVRTRIKRRSLRDRLRREGFDPQWYLAAYEDVSRSGIDPWEHYDRYGRTEGRLPCEGGAPTAKPGGGQPRAVSVDEAKLVLASGWLDVSHVRSQSGLPAGLGDLDIALQFLATDWRDAPNPHPALTLGRYVELNPDIEHLRLHPLTHLATTGLRERRRLTTRSYPPAVPRARSFVRQAVLNAPRHAPEDSKGDAPLIGVVVAHNGDLADLTDTLESLAQQSVSFQLRAIVLVDHTRWPNLDALRERYSFRVLSTDREWTSGSWISTIADREQFEYLVAVPAGLVLVPCALEVQLSKLVDAGTGAVGAQMVDGEGIICSNGGRLFRDGSLLEIGVGSEANHWNMRPAIRVDFARLDCLMMRTADWSWAQAHLRAAPEPLYGAAAVCSALAARGLATWITPRSQAVVVGQIRSLARHGGLGLYAGDLATTRGDFARAMKGAQGRYPSFHVSSPTRIPADGVRAVILVESWASFSARGDRAIVDLLAASGFYVTVGSAMPVDWVDPHLRQELEFLGIEVAEQSGVNDLLAHGYPDPIDLIVGVGRLGLQTARDLHARCSGRPRLVAVDPDWTAVHEAPLDLTVCDLILTSGEAPRSSRPGGPIHGVLTESVSAMARSLAKINGRSTKVLHEHSLEKAFGSDSSRRAPATESVFFFGVIDWWFRVQRPQQLARAAGAAGRRVFYINPTVCYAPDWGLVASDAPAGNVVTLQIQGPTVFSIYDDSLTPELLDALAPILLDFATDQGVVAPSVIVDHPFWRALAFVIPGSTVIYDCMDSHQHFHAKLPAWIDDESQLMRTADIVVTTSDVLQAQVRRQRPFGASLQIHNACWPDLPSPSHDGHESQTECDSPSNQTIVVGYVGALAEWFDTHLLEQVALARPNYHFELYGRITNDEVWRLDQLANVTLHGEVDNEVVPHLMAGFAVGVIPFQLTELIRATDPVKAYEYLRMGTPVVATPLPELRRFPDSGVLQASNANDFAEAVDAAVSKSYQTDLVDEWRDWAATNTWTQRCSQLLKAVSATRRTYSVIVLTYNNLDLTMRCLESIDAYSPHDRLEVIVVDNASTDGTREFLSSFAASHPYVTLLLNESNLGYAAGNNAGLKVATGEIVILLNNDTVVSPGWLDDLGRFFSDPMVGAVGPVTNNAGNEARLELVDSAGPGLEAATQLYCAKRRTVTRVVRSLAFFCVAIRRTVFEDVGLLDEGYGIGMFEDDDYCRRLEAKGLTLSLTDGVFIEHVMSAAFGLISPEGRRDMFEKNLRLYESRWGGWIPHSYRDKAEMIHY